MFRATMCPSSGADDCVMLQPRVGMCRGCGNVVKTGWQVVRPWMGVFSFQTGTVAYRFSYKKWTGSTVAVRSTRTWDPIQPRTRQVAVTISIMPDAVDTVLCATDNRWIYHRKVLGTSSPLCYKQLGKGWGYFKTKLSCVLFIVLTATCFGHCAPSSRSQKCEKNISPFTGLDRPKRVPGS